MPSDRERSSRVKSNITRGMPVFPEPLTKTLSGKKTWQIRPRVPHIRGPVALIESGTQTVVGTCRIVDCLGPLTREQRRTGWRKAGLPPGRVLSADDYVWVLRDVRRMRTRIPYRHPRGAVTWVLLDAKVRKRLPCR